MDYKKSYLLLTLGVWGGGAIVFIGLFLGTLRPETEAFGSILAGLGAAAMVGGLAQALVFYKCPRCGTHFDVRGRKPVYCPQCGGRLDL